MTLVELKKGLIKRMQTRYPPDMYRYYGIEVVEGYVRPAFFTQLRPVSMEDANLNSTENILTFYINYFQKRPDEADILRKVDEIRKLFRHCVKIGDRAVDISGFSYDFIGSDKNILEISFDLSFFGKWEKESTETLMESVLANTSLEG